MGNDDMAHENENDEGTGYEEADLDVVDLDDIDKVGDVIDDVVVESSRS